MFGRLMNGYFYGKSGKGDFRRDDLPKNRWELFWAMLRVRFSALIRLNLMTVIVFLPFLVVVLYNLLTLLTGVSGALSYQMALEAGELTEEYTPELLAIYAQYTADGVFNLGQYSRELTQFCLSQMLLWIIPCILITGPAEAGLAYVCRNWARDEHAFIWADFKDALVENWKQGLGVSAITSVLPFVIYICWNFYGAQADQNALFLVPQILVMMLGIIWMLGLTFMYPLMVSYKMTFGQVVKNGIMLGVGRLPQTVGVRLVVLVPALICAALLVFTSIGMYALLVLGGYYLVLGIALARFIYASFTNGVFDRYINSRIEGVQVNRGLADEDEDEDEDDDEDVGEEE